MKSKFKRTTIVVPEELHRKIKVVGAELDLSFSALTCRIMSSVIDQYEGFVEQDHQQQLTSNAPKVKNKA